MNWCCAVLELIWPKRSVYRVGGLQRFAKVLMIEAPARPPGERLLPALAVVYYVMALALWREAPLEEVLRVVCEGLAWLGGGKADAVRASKSAISQARTRLGPEVQTS